MSDEQANLNTDRELWRERPDDFYADSIHVTRGGGIGMNCGGRVIVLPIREWHKLAASPTLTLSEAEKLVRWVLENCAETAGNLFPHRGGELDAAKFVSGCQEAILQLDPHALLQQWQKEHIL